MEKEFVPYELALELKQLGMDLGWYNYLNFYDSSTKEFCEVMKDVPAPLYQQAFRWFREKYGIKHTIFAGKISAVFYGYDLLHIEEQEFVVNNSDNGGGDCDYTTYEEAESECLKKLIEIAKN